jgi:cytochrome c oxidase subunit III
VGAIPLQHVAGDQQWRMPSRGYVGMASLIVAESAIFTIFVVAYIYYLGRDQYGPTPREVLELPIFNTVCLLSSSLTIWISERAIERGEMRSFSLWWGITWMLGAIFLAGTGREWYKLIRYDNLTIRTNLFGTTYYSLVGLHATHVLVGLLLLLAVLLFAVTGHLRREHSERVQVLALYWHFVDAVWVVVFTVVYIVGR